MAEKKAETKGNGTKQPVRNSIPTYAAMAIGAIIIIAFIYYSSSLQSSAPVPFSTFKQNFNNAARISIAVTYQTQGQFVNESPCYSSIIQVVAHSRAPSTIDFFIINQTACTYSKTGLGGSVQPETVNASYCIGRALNETGIFMNFSSSNYTLIQPQHIYIYGNSEYMRSCPSHIAVDFA